MGSLAFGAFILTLMQIIRMILEYIDHKTRGEADLLWGIGAIAFYLIFFSLMPRHHFPKDKNRKINIKILISWATFSNMFCPLFTRGTESSCSIPNVLPEVLLLLFGEVHQVPQPKRIHHGELSRIQGRCRPLLSVVLLHHFSNTTT